MSLATNGSSSSIKPLGQMNLDLLVDALLGATLFDLGELQVELEELLGVNVDLLTPGDLPQKFRDQVVSKARPL